ncbi:MAG: peptidylprolyl isomerase [Pseudomonadota bacterium]
MFTSFLKQPLFHFLLAGALIFGINQLNSDAAAVREDVDNSVIVVNRTALLDFMQYRAKVFESQTFNDQLDAMTAEEVQVVVNDYVRQEALYREALRMRMDQGDPVIQERLVQKVEFLLENLVAENINPTDQQLEEFYESRKGNYQLDSVYTFTHIFFDAQQSGMEDAKKRADAVLVMASEITYEESAQFGDRFPFLQNYEERTRDFVSNNFSADFVAALDMLSVEGERWQGPISSRYGYHLVMLRARTEPFIPALSETRERVLDDYRYETLLRSRKEAEDKVIAEYEVELSL